MKIKQIANFAKFSTCKQKVTAPHKQVSVYSCMDLKVVSDNLCIFYVLWISCSQGSESIIKQQQDADLQHAGVPGRKCINL